MNKTVQKVHEDRNSVSEFFSTKWDSAIQNAEFYRLIQYSSDQLKKMSAQNRVPYVLDYVTLVMNTLIGDQRDNRTDIEYLPFEASDDVRAELLNIVKDSVLKRNNWVYLESDIFQDGLIEKTGACGYEWSTERNPIGELKCLRIPQAQLMWDLDCREYDLNFAKWVSRTRLYGKLELIQKKPEFKKDILKLNFNVDDLDDLKLNSTYTKQIIDRELGAVGVIEHYERKYHSKFFIKKNQDIMEGYFGSRKEADRAIKDLMAKRDAMISQLNATGQLIDPMELPQFDIVQQEVPYIAKSEIAQNIAFVEEEEQDYDFYPIDKFHPFFHDGEWWGEMDLFRDAQQFINKMFSQIDHQIATNSKGMLFIDDRVPDSIVKQIEEKWSKTGGMMKMPDPEHNLKYIEAKGFDPRLLSAMDVAVVNLEKKSGGSNFLGGKESAAESGVTVRQRIERGGVSSFPVFDNFDRFKLNVGAKVAWFISNYMTAAQKVRIEGDELTELAQKEYPEWFKPSKKQGVGFMEINTTKDNSLDNLKVDIVIDKSRHTVTKNQNTLLQLSSLLQSSPVFAETTPPQLLIQLLDLPASMKRKMTAESEKLMQMRMQQAQAEQNKPPSLSASLKDIEIFDDDPQAQAQFADKFGIKISAPIQPQADKELAFKTGMDFQKQQRDIEFKMQKHEDQMTAKMVNELANRNLERDRMKHEQSTQSDE